MRNRLILCVAFVLWMATSTFAQVSISTNNNSPDNSAMLDVQSATKGMLIPRMTSAQRAAIASPVNGLMIYQTDGVSGFYYYNSTLWQRMGETEHFVGEFYGGGIVFWVDNTGQHGLIVSLVDISTASAWSNITSVLIGLTAQSMWNGQGNSTAIMGQSGHASSAALFCDGYTNANYSTGIYSDWYLPAIDQLSLIYHARYVLNKNIQGVSGATSLAYLNYWSSTEKSSTEAWLYSFDYGQATHILKGNYYWVRAVRDF
jgi:hypothetical protein